MEKLNDKCYAEFLDNKRLLVSNSGIEVSLLKINSVLFPFQKDVVRWALRKGRCAVFLDTGLGKTFIQLEWARLIGGRSLIFAPLSVARQTMREAKKISIACNYVRDEAEIKDGINIANYEMAEHFDMAKLDAIVLDESSILKSMGGKTKTKMISMFRDVKYKLCCTATPAPNDYVELGNHAHFLNVCSPSEMLAMFFINANREHTFDFGNGRMVTKKGTNAGGIEWRLKHHAEEAFFKWLSQWSVMMMKPSDIGYSDEGFDLPPLSIHPYFCAVESYRPKHGLFFDGLHGLKGRSEVRSATIDSRLSVLTKLVGEAKGQWIVWCGLDEESRRAADSFNGECREVTGADSIEKKIGDFEDFQDGKFRVLVTKPRIGGFGMNFQNSNNTAFFGLNDSWETYYQAIRRQWRFGQKRPVEVHLVLSNLEREIYDNIQRKDLQAVRLRRKMVEQLANFQKGELMNRAYLEKDKYKEDEVSGKEYRLLLGDSCKRMAEVKDESVDLSVYSPPFADLFVYSNSERDLGNCRNWGEFFSHYSFIVKEMFRVTKPGRMSCVHSSDIPAMANRDGYIGLKDFPGQVIKLHMDMGWVFFGRCFVQKNPQAQAIRVKSKSLLFVQMNKDSTHSRPALVDHVLIFRKPGDNSVPVTPVKNGELSNEKWISWAHGIWTDIPESGILKFSKARERDDEKHICPLQLGTIERCIKLYSNPGELVMSPFGGIGSEPYMAVRLGRRALAIELKESYFRTMAACVKSAGKSRGMGLFTGRENMGRRLPR